MSGRGGRRRVVEMGDRTLPLTTFYQSTDMLPIQLQEVEAAEEAAGAAPIVEFRRDNSLPTW